VNFRTGTEEQKSERGELLEEIRILIEHEDQPINVELGSDDLQGQKELTQQRTHEKQLADKEREDKLSNF